MADDKIVARHERLSNAGETRYDWQHYIPLLQRKPGALRNGAPFADMPEPLQRLRRGLLRNPGGDRVMAQVLAIVLTAGLDAVLVAVELALETGPPGKVSVEHVVNVLGRLNAAPAPQTAATSLQVSVRAAGRTQRATTACVPTTPPRRSAMTRDVTVELKQLRLHGMAGAWADLVEQGTNAGLDSSRWLVEHLLQAEGTDRAMRSVSHQMHAAKFPVHRDLAGFDFEVSPVDRKLVSNVGQRRPSPTTRTTPCWSADRARARRIWPRPSACRASPGMASACASTRRSTWSMRWSRRRRRARPGASR